MTGVLFFFLYCIVTIVLLIASFKINMIMGLMISAILVLLNALSLQKNKLDSKSTFSFGIMIVSLFFGLGSYLQTVGYIFGPLSVVLGIVLSLISMFFYFFWKEGRKRVEYKVKEEKADDAVPQKHMWQQIKEINARLKNYKTYIKRVKFHKDKGHDLLFSIQLVYVEELRKKEWEEPKNAIDFRILKEVKLNRNEYDEDGNKRTI